MIKIETFLRGADGGFVRVEACHDAPPDLDYIEGAIRLSIDGMQLIGTEEWDYVDQLWCYVAEMVSQLRSSGYAWTYFPDQPIELSFQARNARVLVVVKIGEEVRKANVPINELLAALKAAGSIFFDKMLELAPDVDYLEARQKLLA